MAELRDKEIINISDGCRFGYVGDVELDLETGKVKALVVPGRLRFSDCWAGRRITSFPGNACVASGRTSFWWRLSRPPAGRRWTRNGVCWDKDGKKSSGQGKKCCIAGHTMVKYHRCA